MSKLLTGFVLAVVLFSCGCQIPGILGTPTRHERKVPAEYSLKEHKDQKILVLVDQPAWLTTSANMSYHVSDALGKHLTAKTGIPKENIIGYKSVAEFRSQNPAYYQFSPAETGQKLRADLVLFVGLDDFALVRVAGVNQYKGRMAANTALFKTENGEKIWPLEGQARYIKVGFDAEAGEHEVAVRRLANSFAHCTIRYLYDCSVAKFKIFDDHSGSQWDHWEK